MTRKLKPFLKKLLDNFSRHDVMTLAAALAFYTALALAPLLLITLSVLSLMGPDTRLNLLAQIQSVIGKQAAEAVRVVIEGADQRPDLTSVGGIVGFVILIFTASSVFAQLQSSLNHIWETKPPQGGGVWLWVRRRLLSMGMVLSIGFLAMVSLIVTTVLSFMFSKSAVVWSVVNQAVSFAVFTFLFGAIYQVLPDLEMRWRDALKGGAITAALFTMGKYGIGLYLGRSAVGSAYGATGSLIVFLVWVYYSALILFVGAELSALLTFRHKGGLEAEKENFVSRKSAAA